MYSYDGYKLSVVCLSLKIGSRVLLVFGIAHQVSFLCLVVVGVGDLFMLFLRNILGSFHYIGLFDYCFCFARLFVFSWLVLGFWFGHRLDHGLGSSSRKWIRSGLGSLWRGWIGSSNNEGIEDCFRHNMFGSFPS